MTEAQIEKAMKSLDLTREEAIEMLQEDEAINRMTVAEAESDMTEAQKATAKKMRQADKKKPIVYEFKKRERKPNEAKRFLVNCVYDLLRDMAGEAGIENIEAANPERQVDFLYSGVSYSFTLTAHRPPKS